MIKFIIEELFLIINSFCPDKTLPFFNKKLQYLIVKLEVLQGIFIQNATMKKTTTIICILPKFFWRYPRILKRENILGKIIVEGNDIDGITIFNASSKVGTVSNENGEFTIAVALDDLIEIRALEYQNFDLRVNDAMLASKHINIYLIEEINKLEEVRITNKELTGNINADINIVKTFKPKT